ncbi:MAG: hypothetical protein WAN86_24795, partial [Hyphomicrobiaceae bacterium]
ARQQYVGQLITFFEKQIAASIKRGPLARMTIGKTSARIDAVELDSVRRPAAAMIERIVRSYYDAPEDRIEMGIHVSLGLACTMPAEPHAIVLSLAEPVMIADEMRHRLYIEPFAFDPSLAPPGKSVVKVVMATSYAWEELHRTPERYSEEKHRISESVIRLLDRHFPRLRQQIEMVDVATPMTTLRFTGNGHGYRSPMSSMALALFTGRRLSQSLPGLANFYMVRQWAGVPGAPMVAAMGRDVVYDICRSDRRTFRTAPAGACEPHPASARESAVQ